MSDHYNIIFHASFIHKGYEIDIISYKDIILFPNAAKNLFPRAEGREKIYEEKIAFNIRLQLGLNRKKLSKYNKIINSNNK